MKPFFIVAIFVLAACCCRAEENKTPTEPSGSKTKKRGIFDEGNHLNFDVDLFPSTHTIRHGPPPSAGVYGSGEIVYGRPYSSEFTPLPPKELFGRPLSSGGANLYSGESLLNLRSYAPKQIEYTKLQPVRSFQLPLSLSLDKQQPLESIFLSSGRPSGYREILVRENLDHDIPPPMVPRPPLPASRTQTVARPVALGSGALGYTKLANGGIALGSGSLGYGGSNARFVDKQAAIGENAFKHFPLQGQQQFAGQQFSGQQFFGRQQQLPGQQQQFIGQQLLPLQQPGVKTPGFVSELELQGLHGIQGLQYGNLLSSPIVPQLPVYNKLPRYHYENSLPPSAVNFAVQHGPPRNTNFNFLQSSFVKGLY